MELARLNSPCMDLNVLLSSAFFVQRLEMVVFSLFCRQHQGHPLCERLCTGEISSFTKATGLLVYRAGLCRFLTAYFTLLLTNGND